MFIVNVVFSMDPHVGGTNVIEWCPVSTLIKISRTISLFTIDKDTNKEPTRLRLVTMITRSTFSTNARPPNLNPSQSSAQTNMNILWLPLCVPLSKSMTSMGYSRPFLVRFKMQSHRYFHLLCKLMHKCSVSYYLNFMEIFGIFLLNFISTSFVLLLIIFFSAENAHTHSKKKMTTKKLL